ncbi:hypothetical protein Tco_0602475, partial [Tanacetum coccineum]
EGAEKDIDGDTKVEDVPDSTYRLKCSMPLAKKQVRELRGAHRRALLYNLNNSILPSFEARMFSAEKPVKSGPSTRKLLTVDYSSQTHSYCTYDLPSRRPDGWSLGMDG